MQPPYGMRIEPLGIFPKKWFGESKRGKMEWFFLVRIKIEGGSETQQRRFCIRTCNAFGQGRRVISEYSIGTYPRYSWR